MMHESCAEIFFHVAGVEDVTSTDGLTLIAEIFTVLGRPSGSPDPGRLQNINYEAVTKIDLRPFWSRGSSMGANKFDWRALSYTEYSFVLERPFEFPQLVDVAPSRVCPFEDAYMSDDNILSRQPIDIIEYLLPFLPLPSYMALLSTSRYLRIHALTTFQRHARRFALDLPWAIPLPGYDSEDATLQGNVADKDISLHSADWLHYLSEVHTRPSMRARRWIWQLAHALKETYLEQRQTSP
ncbi:hypothetical protein BDZ89DRAFT_913448, partial [Hymenopellis radicata]